MNNDLSNEIFDLVSDQTLKLIKQKDDLIIQTLKDKLQVNELDFTQLRSRLKCITTLKTKDEMYCLDDIPFIFFSYEIFELDDNYTSRITCKYRIIN